MQESPFAKLTKLDLIRLARLYLSGETLGHPYTPKGLVAELKDREMYAYAAEICLVLLEQNNTVKERKKLLHNLAICL